MPSYRGPELEGVPESVQQHDRGSGPARRQPPEPEPSFLHKVWERPFAVHPDPRSDQIVVIGDGTLSLAVWP